MTQQKRTRFFGLLLQAMLPRLTLWKRTCKFEILQPFKTMYSGTPLIQSPMSQTNLAVLTGDRINEVFFLQENVWSFCRAAKTVAVIMKR